MRKPEFYMHRALDLAAEAASQGEVPVGAVVVSPAGEIIGQGFNQCLSLHDPSAHAEIQALRAAGQSLNNYRLLNCQLYVTLEPCTMCLGAILNARLSHLFYGAKEPLTGVIASVCNLPAQPWYKHKLAITGGLLRKQSQTLLEDFFQARRI